MALTDRPAEFIFDGSPAWSTERARDVMARNAITPKLLASSLEDLKLMMEPAPWKWIVDRLSALVATFSIGRNAPDAKDLTVWLTETTALLADLPGDILADAIDTAVKTRTHGFMPSVGEIRTIADPMKAKRSEMVFRMNLVIAAEAEAAAKAEGQTNGS